MIQPTGSQSEFWKLYHQPTIIPVGLIFTIQSVHTKKCHNFHLVANELYKAHTLWQGNIHFHCISGVKKGRGNRIEAKISLTILKKYWSNFFLDPAVCRLVNVKVIRLKHNGICVYRFMQFKVMCRKPNRTSFLLMIQQC